MDDTELTTQKYINYDHINYLGKQERVNLINSIGGFKSICLVGTQNKSDQTNLAIFSSIIHIGSNPPLFAMISRPAAYARHTLENILETGFYTLNHVNEKIYKQAHQTSARYDRNISEFDVTNLKTEYKNGFFAPFVQESNVQLGMKLREKIDLQINDTVMIIGEVMQLYFPEDCLLDDGFLDIEKAETITCSGLDSYHKTIKLDRLSYAKPNKEITSLL
jgi:flavin reductase (DIM6/NTAB) family NADH-FMN oxidoreductase RutF